MGRVRCGSADTSKQKVGAERPAHCTQHPWDASPQLLLKMPHTTGSDHQSPGSPWESRSSDLGLQTRKLKPREDKPRLGPQAWPLLPEGSVLGQPPLPSVFLCLLHLAFSLVSISISVSVFSLSLSFNPFLFFSLCLFVFDYRSRFPPLSLSLSLCFCVSVLALPVSVSLYFCPSGAVSIPPSFSISNPVTFLWLVNS